MTTTARLTMGSLQFLEPGHAATPSADGYVIEAMVGTNLGNPDQLTEIVQSLLTDGTLAVIERWDNRTVPIRLRLSAPSVVAGPALAKAEAALMAQVLADPRPDPLMWTPPAEDAALTVFDVVSANLEQDTSDGWDFEEEEREERYYLLTLTCLPFARELDPIVIPAVAPNPPSPATSVIDDGTSATNWSATSDGYGGAEQRRNLAVNPSWQYGLTGWTLSGGFDYRRFDGSGPEGGWFARQEALAAIPSGYLPSQIHVTDLIPIGASEDVAVSAAGHTSSTGSAKLRITWHDSGGSVLSSTDGPSVDNSPAWAPLSVSGTSPASTTHFRVASVATGAAYAYIDGVLIEKASSAGAYFDGDTDNTATEVYAWTGAAGNSESVEAAHPTAVVNAGTIETTATKLGTGTKYVGLLRDDAVDMGGLPYLMATVTANNGALFEWYIDGAPVNPVAQDGTDYYFETGDFTTFEVRRVSLSAGPGATTTMAVDELVATDTVPGTGRQRQRFIEVTGSAPTTAELRLFDAGGVLGRDALLYSGTHSFSPNLRAIWLASTTGSTGADSATVTGSETVLDPGESMTFRIEANQLAPAQYAVEANLIGGMGGVTVTVTAELSDDTGAAIVGSGVLTDTERDVPADASYAIVSLGSLPLPPVKTEDPDAYVEVVLTNDGASPNAVTVDEVWLFNLTDGALTHVHDDAETIRWLGVRSPELGAPVPSVYGDDDSDGSSPSSVDHLCESFGVHRVAPGTMQVFTVTTTSTDSQSEGELFRRFHSHVDN